MRFFVWKALARGVVLEALRRKDIWVVAILGFLIIAAAGTLGFFGFSGLEAFAKDLAVNVLGLFSTIIAVLTSCRLMPEEIKNRTLYPLLARPISRFELLAGKLIGAILVSWASFFLLAALTACALMIFKVQFEAIMLQYLVAKMMGLVVLCSIGVMFSCYLTPSAAATMTFIFAFAATMIVRALTMAAKTAPPSAIFFYQALNGMLPQLGLFDLGSRVANRGWAPVPLWVFGFLAAYMGVYALAMLVLSWTKFNRQAI